MAIGIGAVVGGASVLFMLWELLKIGGWGLDQLKDSGIGPELLGISDNELIKKIKSETKKISSSKALKIMQRDEVLRRRESVKKSFATNQQSFERDMMMGELDRQVSAISAGLERGRETNWGSNIPGDQPPEKGPTTAEALGGQDTPPPAQVSPVALQEQPASRGPSLLTEDEREDLRTALIEAGVPPPGTEEEFD